MSPTIKYALISALGSCVWRLLEGALGLHTTHWELGVYSAWLSLLIPLLTLFFAIRHARAEHSGKLLWAEGLRIGLIMGLLSSAFVTLFSIVYNRLLNPGWIMRLAELRAENLRLSGAPDSDLNALVENARAMDSMPAYIVGFMLSVVLSVGIAAIITRLLRMSPAKPVV